MSTRVSIDSLGGRSMRLNLHKRPGMEDEDVLGSDEGETGRTLCLPAAARLHHVALSPIGPARYRRMKFIV